MNNNHDIEKILSETSFRTLSSEERISVWDAIAKTTTQSLPNKSTYTMLKPILTALVLAVVLGGTVALADNSVPGDPLFVIDRAIENARISLASGQKKNDLRIAFADERLKEVERITTPKQATTTTTTAPLSTQDQTRVSAGVSAAVTLLNGVSTTDPRLQSITDELNRYLGTLPADSTVAVHVNNEGEKSRIDIKTVDGKIRIEMKDDEVKVKTEGSSTKSEFSTKKESDDEDEWHGSRGEGRDDDDEDEDEDRPRTTPPVVVTPPAGTTTTTTTAYTLVEVKTHNTQTNCWTAVNGSVYDVTAFIKQHPGGSSAIIGLCGIDGSAAFNGQHGGQARPASELASFKIGVLK